MMPRQFAPKLDDLHLSRKSKLGLPERRFGSREAEETALHEPYGTFVVCFTGGLNGAGGALASRFQELHGLFYVLTYLPM